MPSEIFSDGILLEITGLKPLQHPKSLFALISFTNPLRYPRAGGIQTFGIQAFV